MNKIEFISKLLKGSERLYDLNKVDEEKIRSMYPEVIYNLDLLFEKSIFESVIHSNINFANVSYFKDYSKFWFKQDVNLLYKALQNAKLSDQEILFNLTNIYEIKNIQELKSFLYYTWNIRKINFKLTNYEIESCLKINQKYMYNLSNNDFISFFKDSFKQNNNKMEYIENVYVYAKLFPLFNIYGAKNVEIYEPELNVKDKDLLLLLSPYKDNINLKNTSLKYRWSIIKNYLINDDLYIKYHIEAIITNLLNQKDNKWDIKLLDLIKEIDIVYKNENEYMNSIINEISIYSHSLLNQILMIIRNKISLPIDYNILDEEVLFNNIIWSVVIEDEKSFNLSIYICNQYYEKNIKDYISLSDIHLLTNMLKNNPEYYLNQLLFNPKNNTFRYINENMTPEFIVKRIISIFDIKDRYQIEDEEDSENQYLGLLKSNLNKLKEKSLNDTIKNHPIVYYLLDDYKKKDKKLRRFITKNKIPIVLEDDIITIIKKVLNFIFNASIFLVIFYIMIIYLFKI